MKIIYCLASPPSPRDEVRFGILDTKKRLGAEVEYWFFPSINDSRCNDSYPSTEILKNKSDVRNAFSHLPDVFEIVFTFPFSKKTAWIHKEFSGSKIPYNYLQLYANVVPTLTAIRSLLFRLRFIHLRGCDRLLTCKSCTKFSASPYFLINFKSKIKRVASADYLQFLNLNEGDREPSKPGSEYLLFLDSFLEGHPDFDVPLIRDSARYWNLINQILNKYSQKHSLRIVIKEHPKRTAPIPIKSLVVSKKPTPILIANSALVLCHATTAVSFVALAKIPLIQINLHGLCNSTWYLKWINGINKSLKSKLLEITENDSDCSIPQIDSIKYSNYVKKHIYDGQGTDYNYAEHFLK